LRKVNHAALACGVPWLRVASHGRSGWLGPLVLPGETACYACLEARQEANGRDGAEPLDLSPGAAGDFAPFLCLLAAQAAIEAARFLSGFVAPATVGGAYELSATTPQTRRQAVLRDPACGACGALWLSASELP
ncbi:MAG TPA: TOMM precursor leader peptide-binding protein, partial [Solirubrobacterales bacterium]|nr:TOMM precursor leader peptide-binding protein [Solirubrobacterales bacterium]